MKTSFLRSRLQIGLLMLISSLASLQAEITIRLSVKYILAFTGARPDAGNIGTSAGFDAEITRANCILAATGRGYQLQVVEYLDIRPPVPQGQSSSYWYNLDARANRAVFEAAALADQTTWRWRGDAINIHVNNSSSGQCSFVGGGLSISLGNDIIVGTVLHELGHFFNLRHTHSAADNDGDINDWGDGDGLAETLDDDPDASLANINARYPGESQQKRDDLYFNVMSYHQEDRLLPDQMDLWTDTANGPRNGFTTGRTIWVDRNNACLSPNDLIEPFRTLANALTDIPDGARLCKTYNLTPGNPLPPLTVSLGGPYKTFSAGLNAAGSGHVVMVRAGRYNEPQTINKKVTLTATRGVATIGAP